jgi:Uma2 family endonuclease
MFVENAAEKLPAQKRAFDFRYKREIDLSDETIRYEQIGYTVYAMATPAENHEGIISEIIRQLGNYLKGKPCKVYGSNIGVNLDKFMPQLKNLPSIREHFERKKGGVKEKRAFLLPDISVQCEADGKYESTPYGYPKVPKMVIEVSSPSNWEDDVGFKKDIYELIGVPEYWVVHDKYNVSAFLLKDGKYELERYRIIDDSILEIPVSIFPDLTIKMEI